MTFGQWIAKSRVSDTVFHHHTQPTYRNRIVEIEAESNSIKFNGKDERVGGEQHELTKNRTPPITFTLELANASHNLAAAIDFDFKKRVFGRSGSGHGYAIIFHGRVIEDNSQSMKQFR